MNQKAISRKINTRLLELQSTLTRKLENFYKSKIKNSTQPIETIRSVYERDIKNLIRDTVQSSWLLSHQILEDVITTKDTNFRLQLSVQDIQGIEAATNKVNEQFWTTSGKLQLREGEAFKVNNQGQLEELDPLNIHAALIAFGLFAAYYSYNLGIQSKTGELGLSIKLKFTPREDCIDTQICLPLKGKIVEFGEISLPLHKHCHCHLIPILV